MKSYLEDLRTTAADEQARVERMKLNSRHGDSRVICDKPLINQIEELMRTLPCSEQQRRWTMAEFVARLSGRYSIRPHPMQVGEALRALKWHPKRDWSYEGGGRRYWIRLL